MHCRAVRLRAGNTFKQIERWLTAWENPGQSTLLVKEPSKMADLRGQTQKTKAFRFLRHQHPTHAQGLDSVTLFWDRRVQQVGGGEV